MGRDDGVRVRKKILQNILSSGIEKVVILAVQFLSSIILIRALPREDFGVIGVTIGYFIVISFLNVSFESVILRDHKKYAENINMVINDFVMVNLLKGALIVFVVVPMAFLLSFGFSNTGFYYSIISITLITLADSFVAPFVIYYTSIFNQRLVTKLSIVRSVLSLVLLLGLFSYPYLWYVALKDLVVSLIFVILWFYISRKKMSYRFKINRINYKFIKETFLSYSLWSHFNGVVTNILYRSDTVFLSMFVSLTVVGNYNVALNSANVANVAPSIINYQNSIAVSNAKSDSHARYITTAFLKGSWVIGLLTVGIFYLLGDVYLKLVTGQDDVSSIKFYMDCIVVGLVLAKTMSAPYSSYIAIRYSIKSLFKEVALPTMLLGVTSYFVASMFYGAEGVAVANIIVGAILLMLVSRLLAKTGYFGIGRV